MSGRMRLLLVVALTMGLAPSAAWSQTVTGSIQIAWNANVTDPDLASYRAYASSDSTVFSLLPAAARPLSRTLDVGKSTLAATFTNLDASKTWFFAVTAIDTSGNESVFSSPIVSAQPAVAPIVRTVSPGSAVEGASGMSVSVTGQNFLPTSTVSFGPGVTVTAVNTSGAPTSLIATVNVSNLAQVSTRDVVVTNGATSVGTRPLAFSVLFNPARADVNGSGAVDAADFVDLLLGFPSFLGDAHYRAARDLNVDGKIDGADFAIFFGIF